MTASSIRMRNGGTRPIRVSARRELSSPVVPMTVGTAATADKACECGEGGLRPAVDIDLDWVDAALSAAGIDHDVSSDGGMRISGIGYPAWLAIDDKARTLFLVSHCDGADGLDDAEAMRFANHCNEAYLMIQFAWAPGGGRLYGHLAMPFVDGLTRQQMLRVINRFGAIFSRAVGEGASCGVLLSLIHI